MAKKEKLYVVVWANEGALQGAELFVDYEEAKRWLSGVQKKHSSSDTFDCFIKGVIAK